jgi:hypothetical protein
VGLRHAIIATVALASIIIGATALVAAEPAFSARGDEDLAQLTIEDMVSRASDSVRTMEKQLAESFKLLEESIAKGDVAATTSRNEAITAMKGLVKLSEQNLLTLQQRAAERDRSRVEHEYVKITIAAAKVAEFYAQIKSATGGTVDLELTEVERKLEFQGRLPVVEDLTTTFTTPADVIPEPPVHASPYY